MVPFLISSQLKYSGMISSNRIILHSTGNVLCSPDNPVRVSTSLEARVIVFDVEIPITMGFPVRILMLQVKSVP